MFSNALKVNEARNRIRSLEDFVNRQNLGDSANIIVDALHGIDSLLPTEKLDNLVLCQVCLQPEIQCVCSLS